MPGYIIFEERYLKGYREDGIVPNGLRIGLLDFLRELKGETDAIPRLSSFMVLGVDEVLYLGEDRQKISLAIHKILQSSAGNLDRKKVEVQIICKGKLFKADSFWLEYRMEKIALDIIFGTPTKVEIRGLPVFTAGFNLSS
jgi:hypothetical protein